MMAGSSAVPGLQGVSDVQGASDLEAMDVAARRHQVMTAVADRCDAVIVSKPVNLRWLTGFTGSNGAAAVLGDELLVVTDGRYESQIHQQLEIAGVDANVFIDRNLDDVLLAALADRMPVSARIGAESHHISWDRRQALVEKLSQHWSSGAELVAVGAAIDNLRMQKDGGEVARLRRAAEIADHALAAAIDELVGAGSGAVTERELARRLESIMFDLGADEPSFPSIVASGPNSALPHARPGQRPIVNGDLLVIDMGARCDGYGSDMTRTFAVGGFTVETERLYRAVERSQAAGLALVVDGTMAVDIDSACRESLADDDLAHAFIHGTGHGIGLEIHENPFLSRTGDAILRSGQAITVEPGAYLPNLGGVRIEDSVIVTDSGHDVLTRSPKQPELAL